MCEPNILELSILWIQSQYTVLSKGAARQGFVHTNQHNNLQYGM